MAIYIIAVGLALLLLLVSCLLLSREKFIKELKARLKHTEDIRDCYVEASSNKSVCIPSPRTVVLKIDANGNINMFCNLDNKIHQIGYLSNICLDTRHHNKLRLWADLSNLTEGELVSLSNSGVMITPTEKETCFDAVSTKSTFGGNSYIMTETYSLKEV